MQLLSRIGLILIVAVTAGCAATVSQPSASTEQIAVPSAAAKHLVLVVQGSPGVERSEDWQAFRGEWRAAMAQAAAQAGMKFDFADSGVPEVRAPATLVRVDVRDYRYLSAGARYGLGVFTGNAYVNSDVTFVDLPSKKVLGTRQFNTTSSAWQGVFAPMTTKQLEALAVRIVDEVKQGAAR